MCRNWDLTQPNNFKTFKKKEKCLHAHFSSTYNKIATAQRLAWPLGKDNMQIWEAFHMLCPSPLSWNPLLIHRYTHTHTHKRFQLHGVGILHDFLYRLWREVRLMNCPGFSGQALSSHRLWGWQLRRRLYPGQVKVKTDESGGLLWWKLDSLPCPA